ncbi:MAG: C-type lectin domain-containing protein [Verrucomicrobiota bacterium]
MRRSGLLLTSGLILSGLVGTVGATLPQDSQVILEKLKAFEVEQSNAIHEAVMEKRIAVSESLKVLAVSETKRGDLDLANLINDSRSGLGDSTTDVSEILESHPDLPIAASSLLEKLASFEERERSNAQALLIEKQHAVLKILEAHLRQAMQRGDLEAANALKTNLDALKESELATATELPGTNSGLAQIPDDAIAHDGRYYRIYTFESPMSWEDARKECQKLGGELGWVSGPERESVLRSLINPFIEVKGHSPIWVGGRRGSDGEWEWLDGSKVDRDLQPSDYEAWKNPSNTVMMRWIGSFRVAQNDAKQPKGFLCMWE